MLYILKNKKIIFPAAILTLTLNACQNNADNLQTENVLNNISVSETLSDVPLITDEENITETGIENNNPEGEKIAENIYRRNDGMVYMISETDTPEEAVNRFSENIKKNLILLNVSIPFTKDYNLNASNLAAVLNARYDTDCFYSDGHLTSCNLPEESSEPEILQKMASSQTTEEYIKLQDEIYETVKLKTNGNYDWSTYSLEQIADIGIYIQGIRGHAECPSGKWEDITYSGDPDLADFEEYYNALRSTQFTVYDWVAG